MRIFSRAGKGHPDPSKEDKNDNFVFSSNLPKASVILQPISHDIHRRKCSALYGEDNVFVKMYATLPNFLIGQIGGLLACVKFCLRRGTFSGLMSGSYDAEEVNLKQSTYFIRSDATENAPDYRLSLTNYIEH